MYIIPSISRDKVLIQSVEDHAQLPEFAQLLLVSTDMCAECCVVCIVLISTMQTTIYFHIAGPAPAILDWCGHCVRVNVNKLGGSGGMLPQEN